MTYHQPPPHPVGPVHTQVVVAPHRCSTAHIVIAWVFAAVTLGYLLPWAIAATRNRSNVAPIALINLFLGWSLIAWVVALVMACGSDTPPVVIVQQAYGPDPRWSGVQAWQPQPWQQPRPQVQPWLPSPGALPPAPRDRGPEPTVLDPRATEATRPVDLPWEHRPPHDRPPLDRTPLDRPLYDPPAYGPRPGSGYDDRR